MARHKGDPARLIERLKAALKRARKDDIADAKGMAQIVAMSWRNLLITHIEPDKGFPIVARGAEGVAWQFHVQTVLRHMIARAQERIAENKRRVQDHARMTGIDVPETETGTSMTDLRALLDMTLKVQAEKRDQRDKVDAAEVRKFLTGMFGTIVETIMGSGSVVDPTGDMAPHQRAAFDDHMRDLCLKVKEEVAAFTGEYRAGSIKAGAGGRD